MEVLIDLENPVIYSRYGKDLNGDLFSYPHLMPNGILHAAAGKILVANRKRLNGCPVGDALNVAEMDIILFLTGQY